MSLPKVIKTGGWLPREEAALKLAYLVLRNASAKCEIIQHSKQALNQFEMLWGNGTRAATHRA